MKKELIKSKLERGLPKDTTSLCPECGKMIPARIFEEDGRVMIGKSCPEHGEFKDVYWSDVDLYLRAEKWAFDGKGVSNPLREGISIKECPFECGLCNLHLSHTCLANLDLTNRCNLKCPICFANAEAVGYVYEPSYNEVVEMMKVLRAERPVPCPSIQFAGGEPTIYPHFLKVIEKARELGFAQIQVATNGLKMAEDPDFCQKMVDAGMHTIYLQFDGFKEETYLRARGRKDLLAVKLKAIENCRRTSRPLATVLVPTIVRGINDDEVGKIVEFGIRNSDVIRAVNFQPVAFTGRINKKELEEQRYTLPDLVSGLVQQTNFLKKSDFYPVPIVAIVSDMFKAIVGEEKVSFTAHPHCGLATFVFIGENGQAVPINRFVDVDGLFTRMKELTDKAKRHQFLLKVAKKVKKKQDAKVLFEKYFGEFVNEEKMPEGLDIIDFVSDLFSDKTKKSLGKFTWKAMMIGGMHFQDSYNYDIQRVMRCVIHYVVPDGRIIPFCAYNGGPTYREEVEKKYSIPLKEWKEKRAQK